MKRVSRRQFIALGGAAVLLGSCADKGRVAERPAANSSATAGLQTAEPASAAPPTHTRVPRATLALAGDVMLDRGAGWRIANGGAAEIFAGVREQLAAADIAAVNLECALSDLGSPQDKGYTFRAHPDAIAALTSAGIDVVTLANNHALDFGPDALLDTAARCRAAGIATVGAGGDQTAAHTPVVFERGGLRLAFLGYVDAPAERSFSRATWSAGPARPGVAWLDLDEMRAEVAAAKASADHVIVMFHFGFEFQTEPSAAQVEQAQAAIDAGATVVAGHHPHVLQRVEEYGGGLIAYSLGNFVFDGFDPPANDSAILHVELGAAGVQSYDLAPVKVVDGLPRLAR